MPTLNDIITALNYAGQPVSPTAMRIMSHAPATPAEQERMDAMEVPMSAATEALRAINAQKMGAVNDLPNRSGDFGAEGLTSEQYGSLPNDAKGAITKWYSGPHGDPLGGRNLAGTQRTMVNGVPTTQSIYADAGGNPSLGGNFTPVSNAGMMGDKANYYAQKSAGGATAPDQELADIRDVLSQLNANAEHTGGQPRGLQDILAGGDPQAAATALRGELADTRLVNKGYHREYDPIAMHDEWKRSGEMDPQTGKPWAPMQSQPMASPEQVVANKAESKSKLASRQASVTERAQQKQAMRDINKVGTEKYLTAYATQGGQGGGGGGTADMLRKALVLGSGPAAELERTGMQEQGLNARNAVNAGADDRRTLMMKDIAQINANADRGKAGEVEKLIKGVGSTNQTERDISGGLAGQTEEQMIQNDINAGAFGTPRVNSLMEKEYRASNFGHHSGHLTLNPTNWGTTPDMSAAQFGMYMRDHYGIPYQHSYQWYLRHP